MVYVRHARQYCPRGHHLTEDTTLVSSGGSRACLTCRQEHLAAELVESKRPTPTRADPAPKTATFKCAKCRRTLLIPDADRHTSTTLVRMVQTEGWTVLPQILCALHAATAEAYAAPDYRRSRRQ